VTKRWTVLYGDLLRGRDEIATSGEFDAVLTDAPYELGFMGKRWDKSGVAFDPETWSWILKRLRPGAHMLAFGGTRTFHRMTCAIEDGGFEIRDCMSWLYGQGFPKSLDVGKFFDDGTHALDLAERWKGYGTALKPAWEPIVVARVAIDDTITKNVQVHGTGALAIDACRLATDYEGPRDGEQSADRRYGERGGTNLAALPGARGGAPNGRFPANVVLDIEAAKLLDGQSGVLTSGQLLSHHKRSGGSGNVGTFDIRDRTGEPCNFGGDSGGASRFFYVAKVATSERNDGLDDLPELPDGNDHPTLKPVALTEYLAKLLLPPRSIGRPRRILVPFSGTGSEMIGALRAGWDEVVGIENDEKYVRVSRLRLTRVDTSHQASLFEGVA
jgi:hypothetical protein